MSLAPLPPRTGDYAMQFGSTRDVDYATARAAMKRQGCRTIRFEPVGDGFVAHGYLAQLQGHNVEEIV